MVVPSTEICDHCGHVIRDSETAMVWHEKVVCATCYIRLDHEARVQAWKHRRFMGVIALCASVVGLIAGALIFRTPSAPKPPTVSSKPLPVPVKIIALAPAAVPKAPAGRPPSAKATPQIAGKIAEKSATLRVKPLSVPAVLKKGKPAVTTPHAAAHVADTARISLPAKPGSLHTTIAVKQIVSLAGWNNLLNPLAADWVPGSGRNLFLLARGGRALDKIDTHQRRIKPFLYFPNRHGEYLFRGTHGHLYVWSQPVAGPKQSEVEIIRINPKTRGRRIIATIASQSYLGLSCGGMAETSDRTLCVAVNQPFGLPFSHGSPGKVIAVPPGLSPVVVARFKAHQVGDLCAADGAVIAVTFQSSWPGHFYGCNAIIKVGTHIPLQTVARFNAAGQSEHRLPHGGRIRTGGIIPGQLSLPIQKTPGNYLYGLSSQYKKTNGLANWVFRISRKSGHVKILANFITPKRRVIIGFAAEPDGNVFVTANGGPFGFGRLMLLKPGHQLKPLVEFSGQTGIYPQGPLFPLSGGVVGFNAASGPMGHGTVFFASRSGAVTAKSLPSRVSLAFPSLHPGILAGRPGHFYVSAANRSLYEVKINSSKLAAPARLAAVRNPVVEPQHRLATAPGRKHHSVTASPPPGFGVRIVNLVNFKKGGFAPDFNRKAVTTGGDVYYQASDKGAYEAQPDSVLVKVNLRTGANHAIVSLGKSDSFGTQLVMATRHLYAFVHRAHRTGQNQLSLSTFLLRVNIGTGNRRTIILTHRPNSSFELFPSYRGVVNPGDGTLYISSNEPPPYTSTYHIRRGEVIAIPRLGKPRVLYQRILMGQATIGALHSFGNAVVGTTSSDGNDGGGDIFIVGIHTPFAVLRSFRSRDWSRKNYPKPGILPRRVPLPGKLSRQGLVVKSPPGGTVARAYGLMQLSTKNHRTRAWAFECSSASKRIRIIACFGGQYGPVPTSFGVEPNGTMVFTNSAGRYGFGQLLAVGPDEKRKVLFNFSPRYGVFPRNTLVTLRDGILGWTTGGGVNGRAGCFFVPGNGSPVRIAPSPRIFELFQSLNRHAFIPLAGNNLLVMVRNAGAFRAGNAAEIEIHPTLSPPENRSDWPQAVPVGHPAGKRKSAAAVGTKATGISSK